MKILVINWRDIKNPHAGGAELYLQSLCCEFVQLGHEVYFYTSGFSGAIDREEINGVKITRVGGKFSVYLTIYLLYLKQRENFDVILESINTIPFLVGLYAKQPVIPIIYSINNSRALLRELGVTPISLVGLLFNSVISRIYRKKTTITISNTSKEELSRAGFIRDNVFVVKPSIGCEFEQLSQIPSKSKKPLHRIIYVGRLKKYKGIEIIIRAVAILKKDVPVELLIVGKGDYEAELRRIVVESGLTSNVHFTGFVSEAQKVLLLRSSSVFACCSIDEGGWTIAGLEAMRCGLPLVVTESQKDLVIDGITGFVASYDPKVVAEKIRDVYYMIGKKCHMSQLDYR